MCHVDFLALGRVADEDYQLTAISPLRNALLYYVQFFLLLGGRRPQNLNQSCAHRGGNPLRGPALIEL